MNRDKAIEIITGYLDIDPAELSPDRSLKSLGIDSLDFVEIFFELEEQLKIKIPGEMAELREKVVSVGDVYRLLEEHCGESDITPGISG